MILSINTSEKLTKISLLDKDFSIISEKECTLNAELSERLLFEVEQLLKNEGMGKSDLSRILVNEGPGSYTGLRIGITTANFLAFSLGIPVLAYELRPECKKTPTDNKTASNMDKFINPVLPYYNQPPHITKPVLPS